MESMLWRLHTGGCGRSRQQKRCTTDTQMQDREQESIAVVHYEDPSTTEAVEAYVSPGRTIRNTHWQWLMGSVSTARRDSSKRSGKSLWHLDRKRWAKACVTVLTVWMNKKHNNRSHRGTALYVGQDRPETHYTKKEAAIFMSDPTRAAKCLLKRLCM